MEYIYYIVRERERERECRAESSYSYLKQLNVLTCLTKGISEIYLQVIDKNNLDKDIIFICNNLEH